MAARCRVSFLAVVLIGLAGLPPIAHGGEQELLKFPDTQYEPVEWANLDGWTSDDHAAAFATFLASCRALNASRQPSPVAMTEALKAICERAVAAVPLEEDGARKFFEDNFRPLRISKLGDTDGYLTGYY
jgi:membrane-bound lytic murein transglycosylase A